MGFYVEDFDFVVQSDTVSEKNMLDAIKIHAPAQSKLTIISHIQWLDIARMIVDLDGGAFTSLAAFIKTLSFKIEQKAKRGVVTVPISLGFIGLDHNQNPQFELRLWDVPCGLIITERDWDRDGRRWIVIQNQFFNMTEEHLQ